MAILAEEIVAEWLNRQGYFTIRGIKLGVHEIDLLAIRPNSSGFKCRHLEVQASIRPVSYLSRVPKEIQEKTGRSATSAKRRTTKKELSRGVKEWVEKKYLLKKKDALRKRLASGQWSFELVVHNVKHPEELDLIRKEGIKVHFLSEIVRDLKAGGTLVTSAAGADFADLVLLETDRL